MVAYREDPSNSVKRQSTAIKGDDLRKTRMTNLLFTLMRTQRQLMTIWRTSFGVVFSVTLSACPLSEDPS